jgi:hypothetical protein
MMEPDGGSGDRSLPRRDAVESGGRWGNLIIIAFVIFVIGGGLWLIDALLAARKADECMSSGRRNCTPIEAPGGDAALIASYRGG